MDSTCLWEHQNSLDQSDMRYIEQVPSDVCYWVVLSTPKGVNHIDRLNYISRYFSPLLQRPFAITAHPLPLKSELIWLWVALKSSTVPEGRMLLGGGNLEKMWSVQLSLGVLTVLTMTVYVPSTHGEPFLLQGKLEYRLQDTGRWFSFALLCYLSWPCNTCLSMKKKRKEPWAILNNQLTWVLPKDLLILE